LAETRASAVEEQSVTTNKINRNITEASKGSTAIAENNSGLVVSANKYSSLANQVKASVDELNSSAKEQELELKRNFNL
jgi:methyl-accepting chemotaxis protein